MLLGDTLSRAAESATYSCDALVAAAEIAASPGMKTHSPALAEKEISVGLMSSLGSPWMSGALIVK